MYTWLMFIILEQWSYWWSRFLLSLSHLFLTFWSALLTLLIKTAVGFKFNSACMLNIISSVVHYIFLAQSDLTVWTVCRQHTKHCVLWCAFIGARPKVVSCSPRELKNADPFIHNINDVCAKASQILTTSQWHTEASVRKNHWWQDKGWLCQAVHLKHFSRSHTVWVAIVVILLSVHPSVLVLCEYSKLMQLFEIFEYLFNRDQPRDWRAICLYFASHKLPHSPVSWTQCCATCVPTPPTPLSALTTHGTHARRQLPCMPCVLPAPASTVTSDGVITGGGREANTVHSQLSAGLSVSIVIQLEHGDMLHLNFVVILVLPMWYCHSRWHMPHAVSSARCKSEKPLQLSYIHA